MKRYIKCNAESDLISEINELAQSGRTSAIAQILDDMSENTFIKISTDEAGSHTSSFTKEQGKWVEGWDASYSSYDIADELVRGRYHYLVKISKVVKETKPNVPYRDKPSMWR